MRNKRSLNKILLSFLISVTIIFLNSCSSYQEIIIPHLPSGPSSPAKFGAYYTKLNYYPEWDKQWRVGDYADVVVRFDTGGEKFVFWRGTNYIPHWVSENNIWYNNEFTETWETIGSSEPMSDKQCRYSNVRIIENNDARVVVHWRYALNDVNYRIAFPDSSTSWGDWCDEYYILYPDGIGTRKVVLFSNHLEDNRRATADAGHEWQEGIVLYHANTTPEEVVNIDAVHVANMNGEVGKWSWEIHGKPKTEIPKESNIVLMNLKSVLKPFIISELGCNLDAYEGSQGGSHFRWRDHWPTTTEPTPGRNASGKQAAHGSFFHLTNIPIYQREKNSITKVMLHGMTDKKIEDLVPIAKSWINSPVLSDNKGFTSNGYDIAQRAYILTANELNLNFKINASEKSPLINPCFVIKNWDENKPSLIINDLPQIEGKDYRIGIERTLEGNYLIIWTNLNSHDLTKISLSRL